MTTDDHILRALRDGDEACPDGRFLAALGRATRSVGQPPDTVSLLAGVRAGVASAQAQDDDALIDDLYDGDSAAAAAADPGLARLRDAVRSAGELEREPDLLPRIQDGILRNRSSRRIAADLDGHARWRIWTAVVAGHVAALLALAVFNVQMDHQDDDADIFATLYQHDLTNSIPNRTLPNTLPQPKTWSELGSHPGALFLLRQDENLREASRHFYGLEGATGAVRGACAWLIDQRDSRSGAIGPLTGEPDLDLAVQSLAALALLGEGTTDLRRTAAIRGVASWLTKHRSHIIDAEPTAAGLATLALVEAAILCQDDEFGRAAREALHTLAQTSGTEHGGAWLLLAAETARTDGWTVPHIAVTGTDSIDRDLLAVQITSGVNSSLTSVPYLLEQSPKSDRHGQVDLLAWWAPSLAMREVGGRLWNEWRQDLEFQVKKSFTYSDADRAWIDPDKVRHADLAGPAATVFATSLGVLNLQVGYRYLPLGQ